MDANSATIEKSSDQVSVKSGKNAITGLVTSKKVSWLDIVAGSHNPFKSASPPLTLSANQKIFLRWHAQLDHLPFSIMLHMFKRGLLPKEFVTLQKDLPLCGSCLRKQGPLDKVNRVVPFRSLNIIIQAEASPLIKLYLPNQNWYLSQLEL